MHTTADNLYDRYLEGQRATHIKKRQLDWPLLLSEIIFTKLETYQKSTKLIAEAALASAIKLPESE
jgi:hypothetical protein